MKKTILAICAHNDDQIIGPGGTLTKYAGAGYKFKTIIFSYGAVSHPHLKPEVIIKERMKESRISDKIMGGDGIIYLGAKEGTFLAKKDEWGKKISEIIKKEKPVMIFTHTDDDPHRDHKAVDKIVQEMIKKKIISCNVYTFDVWNMLRWKRKNLPRLVIDISETFGKKIQAFHAHKSQKASIISLLWSIYLKAVLYGWKYGYKYAEVFYKIK